MPANPRVRADNVFGTVSDSPLTNVATTMNSAGLANLPAISSQHAVLVLDPLRSAGAPEVVVVTAHTGAATSATITRGAYGTTARQHASGTLWVHAPTVEDFIRIVAASSDITDPYRGQLAYDRVLDKFIARNQSDVWQDVVALGAWQTFTPTLTQSGAVTKTVTYARYAKVGRLVIANIALAITGTGTGGNSVLAGLPLTAVTGPTVIGAGYIYDLSADASYRATVEISTSTTVAFRGTSATTNGFLGSQTFTDAFASGDLLTYAVMYEAAS